MPDPNNRIFKITIEARTCSVAYVQEYKVIADTGNERDGKSVYGYVDSPNPQERSSNDRIYEQTFECPDINQIIRAVNKAVNGDARND